jgi:hypothetical protein
MPAPSGACLAEAEEDQAAECLLGRGRGGPGWRRLDRQAGRGGLATGGQVIIGSSRSNPSEGERLRVKSPYFRWLVPSRRMLR